MMDGGIGGGYLEEREKDLEIPLKDYRATLQRRKIQEGFIFLSLTRM